MMLLLIFMILNTCFATAPLTAHQYACPATIIDCNAISEQGYERVIAEYSATELLANLEQYARDAESEMIQVCIDQDNLSESKRTILLYNTNSGSAFPAGANINVVGGSNITTTGADSTITIAATGLISTSFPTDSGTATPSNNALTIHGGSNINTSGSGSTVTVNLNNSPSVSGSITAGTGLIATSGGINCYRKFFYLWRNYHAQPRH